MGRKINLGISLIFILISIVTLIVIHTYEIGDSWNKTYLDVAMGVLGVIGLIWFGLAYRNKGIKKRGKRDKSGGDTFYGVDNSDLCYNNIIVMEDEIKRLEDELQNINDFNEHQKKHSELQNKILILEKYKRETCIEQPPQQPVIAKKVGIISKIKNLVSKPKPIEQPPLNENSETQKYDTPQNPDSGGYGQFKSTKPKPVFLTPDNPDSKGYGNMEDAESQAVGTAFHAKMDKQHEEFLKNYNSPKEVAKRAADDAKRERERNEIAQRLKDLEESRETQRIEDQERRQRDLIILRNKLREIDNERVRKNEEYRQYIEQKTHQDVYALSNTRPMTGF